MTAPPAKVVLDASAVLAWLLAERSKDVIDKLLPVAVVPSSAMTEALYIATIRGHALSTQELRDALAVAGVRVEAVSDDDSVRAADLIAASRASRVAAGALSLGDGLCIAVAERLDLPIVGGDQAWEALDLRVRYHPFN